MFQAVPLSIIRSFPLYTQQWYMLYWFADRLWAGSGWNLYDIYHCCVYSGKTPDDGQRNCPKHVEFHSKNKFEKLVHLVGFIVRIYIFIIQPTHAHTTFKMYSIIVFIKPPTWFGIISTKHIGGFIKTMQLCILCAFVSSVIQNINCQWSFFYMAGSHRIISVVFFWNRCTWFVE